MNEFDSAADIALKSGPLTGDQLELIDRHWRAANYLSVGQITRWTRTEA